MQLLQTAFSFPAADAVRTARFYEAVFGKQNVSQEEGTVALTLPGITVFFVQRPDYNLLLKPAGIELASTDDHSQALCTVTVATRDNAYAALRLAEESGGTACCQAVPYSWGVAAYFRDPDGHLWEVIWRDPNQ